MKQLSELLAFLGEFKIVFILTLITKIVTNGNLQLLVSGLGFGNVAVQKTHNINLCE
jgi:hypothetical protein